VLYTSHNIAIVLLVEDPAARVLRVFPDGSSRVALSGGGCGRLGHGMCVSR
jgi:hypothetical protein